MQLGIEILSCNIQNITDENGLIRDLGADNTAMIKKNASIAKAQADRDVAIAQAEADKAANEARVLSDTQIAQKNTELEVKKAELKIMSDTKQAEADAAYLIQEQEQQKSIEPARVNAQIARAERDAELKNRKLKSLSKNWMLRSAPRLMQSDTIWNRNLKLICSGVRKMPKLSATKMNRLRKL